VIAIEHESISKLLFPQLTLGTYQDLDMLKFTSLAIGLLTAISIVPSAQAFPIADRTPVIVTQSYRGDRTPVVVKVVSPTYQGSEDRRGWESNRRRQWEIAREREARARWEARHSRYKYNQHNSYRNDRYGYNEYRRDRY
jgi:hypothetical protein